MALMLFDSLSRTLQPLAPADGSVFRMYCCGPTVYGPAHVGNFRSFVLQDVLRRLLELEGGAHGWTVKHVRNLTDVDDKTIRQSHAEGLSLESFTAKWTDKFHRDCSDLNVLAPSEEPAATGHIDAQIVMIARLVEKGHAYPAPDGSVYFKISSFPQYGKLSRLDQREITTGTAAVAADEYNRDSAADFALWKAHKPEDGEVSWPSPWGPGRPGWHIECSAMSVQHLGETLDLHAGGVDLKFPHHENEIAQSEACTGRPFARHWFHTEHLMVDGRKMSKSLGNLYTLDDIRARGFSPMALRYVLLSGHYQQQLNFTWDSLQAAESALNRLERAAEAILSAAELPASSFYDRAALLQQVPGAPVGLEEAWQHLTDDLNTPAALGALFSALHAGKLAPGESPAQSRGRAWAFAKIADALGLNLHARAQAEVPTAVKQLADERWQARSRKDWARADALRSELKAVGWNMLDGKDGYRLEIIRQSD